MDIHLEQGIGKSVSKAAGVEVAVGSAVVLVIVDLRELKAAVLQQLIVMKLLMGQVNLFRDIIGIFSFLDFNIVT